MTLTSLTNALAFAIGALVPTVELRAFCLVAGAAITVDWLYQLSFFAGVLARYGLGDTGRRANETSTIEMVELKPPSQPSPGAVAQATVVLANEAERQRRRPSWLIRAYCRWLLSWYERVA